MYRKKNNVTLATKYNETQVIMHCELKSCQLSMRINININILLR